MAHGGAFLRASGLAFAALLSACATAGAPAQPLGAEDVAPQVMIHPPFHADYSCTEHWAGQLDTLGDALGTDCYITQVISDDDGRAFARAFEGDGTENHEWYSWHAPLLSPIDGEVVRVSLSSAPENTPGQPGSPPASIVVFERADGMRILFAHLGDVSVKKGDMVTRGQPFAVVRNDGFSRSPHVHIGAWKGQTPYQIRHDLAAKGRLLTR